MKNNPKNGYITLVSALVATTIGLAVAVSLLLLGAGFLKNALAFDRSGQSKALTNACVEEALQHIRLDTNYTGSDTITFDTNKTCNYTVTAQSGENRTITAYGNVFSTVRKIKVTISAINPKIIIATWLEPADF